MIDKSTPSPSSAEVAALIERLREMRLDPPADFERDIWSCKIGETPRTWEAGGDGPMRDAVAEAYKQLTGKYPTFIFSGWGRHLTEGERAVVENREPDFAKTDFGALTKAADSLTLSSAALESFVRQREELLKACDITEEVFGDEYDKEHLGLYISKIRAILGVNSGGEK